MDEEVIEIIGTVSKDEAIAAAKAKFVRLSQSVSETDLRRWSGQLCGSKRGTSWGDGSKELRKLLANPTWLVAGDDGAVQNPDMQFQNACDKRCAEMFQADLERERTLLATSRGKRDQAERLCALAAQVKHASKQRAFWTCAAIWEAARFLYFTQKLPAFWNQAAEDEERLQIHVNCGYDDLLCSEWFPLIPFPEIEPAIERQRLERLLVGALDKTARVLGLKEWMRSLAIPSANKLDQVLKHDLHASMSEQPKAKPIEEHRLESADGMVSLMVVSVKWDATDARIGEDFKTELKRLRDGRKPTQRRGVQPDRNSKMFRGLACLWLETGAFTPTEIAKEVYPRPKKGSKTGARTDDVKEAITLAKRFVTDVLGSLQEAAPVMNHPQDEKFTAELQAAIDAAFGRPSN